MLNTKDNIKQIVQREADHLLTIKHSDRPWHLVLISALAISLSILIGLLLDQLSTGILASLGAMIVLNQPGKGNLWQRQGELLFVVLMMVVSFALGLVAHNLPMLRFPIFVLVTFSVVILGRYLHLAPPGGLFIMMSSVIAILMPVGWDELPTKVGVVALGALFAWFMVLLYNLIVIKPASERVPSKHGYEPGLITDSVVVTTFVVLSMELALWLEMPYPYWVPMSCFVIIQGMQLRTIWIKHFHRILGTAIGMVVASVLLALPVSPLGVVILIFFMFIWIESLVVRHYALAVVMITPLTIFIAEYGRDQAITTAASALTYQEIIQARFWDTVLGCTVALIGGVVMHSVWFRRPVTACEAKIMNRRNVL